ncbi:MAG: amino acid aminotransferase [Planctomycetota bacterium]|jgi:aspartate aminotransferase/aromatic-amino-acid transaminase
MFEKLQMAPADPILGLTEAFNNDPNPDKINLGVGVYKDESGTTPILACVKAAEERILKAETTKSYLPIPGGAEFAAATQQLLFGAGSDIIADGKAATAQTPGGTGALRIAGEFLKKLRPTAKVWLSNPTWSNHLGVFGEAGFQLQKYPYYDADGKCIDFEAMINALKAIGQGDIVLLHACCHNPTGIDPALEQWKKILDVVSQQKFTPLLDFAYQGLANGIEEDAAGLRLFCDSGLEMLIASSFSKNFGLYKERVGALTVVCDSAETAQNVLSHIKIRIRRNYSNPPSHGAAIVSTIMNDPQLRTQWEAEVATIRERIRQMRELFVKTLKEKGVQRDFSFITKQNGMFSFSGLTKDQVNQLREKYSVYIVGSGRINVAGMTPKNMDRLCEAIADVLQ